MPGDRQEVSATLTENYLSSFRAFCYTWHKKRGHRVAEKTEHAASSRRLHLPKRHWYNPRTWRRNIPLPPRRKISSTAQLIREATRLIRKDWRTFAGITAVYAVGVFVFVKSFSIGSVTGASGNGALSTAVSRFSTMLSDAGSSLSAASGIYQIIVSTICSLALIWYFRQALSGEKTGVKRSFYQGMRPLVPYLLVLAMIGVQLIPMAVGGYLLSLMQSSYLLFGWEIFVAGAIFGLLALWSLRLLTHSVFALFVVTLPDMTPLRALRGAKKMVYRRRLTIWRKLVLAVLFAAVIVLAVMLPFMVWLPSAAPWMFFLITACLAMIGQAFLYTIYREIL
jgi:hypothetical protein